MIMPIESHTKEQHTNALAAYHPVGQLFTAKLVQSTIYRRLLEGLSCERQRIEAWVKLLQDDFIPNNTTEFIPDWERALGIPDDCFSNTGPIEVRRRNILAKLASLGVQTAEDFEALALIFGITVNVSSGTAVGDTFPLVFPIVFPLSDFDARFTIVVEYTPTTSELFPYTYPFTFGEDVVSVLRCLFNKLKPANCQVIFVAI